MSRLNINLGTTANDRTGDPLRTAFDKVNQNFIELYNTASPDLQLPAQSGQQGKFLSTDGVSLSWVDIVDNSTGDLSIVERTIAATTRGDVVIRALGPGSPPSGPSLEYNWTFNTGGRLQLPLNGDIIDSNGLSVLTSNNQTLNTTDSVTFDQVLATAFNVTSSITTVGSSTSVMGAASTVIHSQSNWFTSLKLVIQVEGRLDGDITLTNHTQTCEATVAAIYNNNDVEPVMSVYGVVYTTAEPLATFTVRRGTGLDLGKIQILATNNQSSEGLIVKVHATQFVSRYD